MVRKGYPVIILCSILLLPFCYACFFAMPFADDFCFGWTAAENIPFTQKVLNQYLYWNGRYTSDILVNLHPILTGQLWVTATVFLIALLATVTTLFTLVRIFLGSTAQSIALALCFTLLWLNNLPVIAESFYWYIGQANYFLPNLFLLLHVALIAWLLRNNKSALYKHILAWLLLIAGIGCNENAALLATTLYGAAFFITKTNKQYSGYQKMLAAYLATAVIAALFVFLSPGNFVRSAQFTHNHQLFPSLLMSGAQTLRFTGKWVINYPFLVLSLFAAGFAYRFKNKVGWALPLLAGFIAVYSAFFLPYYATGMLGQHRTAAFVYPWFVTCWLLFVINISNKYGWWNLLADLHQPKYFMALAATALLLSTVTGNSLLINRDIARGNFTTYKKAFLTRQQGILLQPGKIPALTKTPATFTITDTRADTTWWVDKCMGNFYTQRGIILK